jgi:hypothetical protein
MELGSELLPAPVFAPVNAPFLGADCFIFAGVVCQQEEPDSSNKQRIRQTTKQLTEKLLRFSLLLRQKRKHNSKSIDSIAKQFH